MQFTMKCRFVNAAKYTLMSIIKYLAWSSVLINATIAEISQGPTFWWENIACLPQKIACQIYTRAFRYLNVLFAILFPTAKLQEKYKEEFIVHWEKNIDSKLLPEWVLVYSEQNTSDQLQNLLMKWRSSLQVLIKAPPPSKHQAAWFWISIIMLMSKISLPANLFNWSHGITERRTALTQDPDYWVTKQMVFSDIEQSLLFSRYISQRCVPELSDLPKYKTIKPVEIIVGVIKFFHLQ